MSDLVDNVALCFKQHAEQRVEIDRLRTRLLVATDEIERLRAKHAARHRGAEEEIAAAHQERDEARAEVYRLRDMVETWAIRAEAHRQATEAEKLATERAHDGCADPDLYAATVAENNNLRMLLRDIEWNGGLYDQGRIARCCPCCGREPVEGHNAVCRLDAAIGGEVRGE